MALGVRDAEDGRRHRDPHPRRGGEARPDRARGFLRRRGSRVQRINPRQSGRLELAAWLTSPKNPLTPRVMVNRVWQHLFGEGLVSSVDNFGVTGDTPSHPGAAGSPGRAVRSATAGRSRGSCGPIVLSRAYQLGSRSAGRSLRSIQRIGSLWRHSPRRLEAEEIRDAMLAAAGRLNLARPGASPAKDMKVVEMRNNGPEAKRLVEEAQASTHRSVYLPLLRGITPRSLEVFDFAEQGMVTGRRDATTVAPQALYLLNDPFVRRQSLALAGRLLRRPIWTTPARIRPGLPAGPGRSATATEIDRVRGYLADYARPRAKRADVRRRPSGPASARPCWDRPSPLSPVN